MFEHMVTKPTRLNLSPILTCTIVWGGLQCRNIYPSTPWAVTQQADDQLFVADELPLIALQGDL